MARRACPCYPESFARAALYFASVPRIISHKIREDFQSIEINSRDFENGAKIGVLNLLELEQEILEVSENVIKGVLKEYWGVDVAIEARLSWFINRLDEIYDQEPRPSDILFGGRFARK